MILCQTSAYVTSKLVLTNEEVILNYEMHHGPIGVLLFVFSCCFYFFKKWAGGSLFYER